MVAEKYVFGAFAPRVAHLPFFLILAKEWSDVRLQAARKQLHDHIENDNVHKFLILNVDQVWRQALRFAKWQPMKGKMRF